MGRHERTDADVLAEGAELFGWSTAAGTGGVVELTHGNDMVRCQFDAHGLVRAWRYRFGKRCAVTESAWTARTWMDPFRGGRHD